MTWLISDEARKHRAFREVWVAYLLGGLYLLLGLYTEISDQNYSVRYDAQQKWWFVQQNIYSYGATLTAFLLAVGLPRLVCCEREYQTDDLVGTAALGRRYTWRAKTAFTVLYCVAVVFIIGAASLLVNGGAFGFEGALSPVAGCLYFADTALPPMSNLAYCALQYGFLLLGALYFAGFILIVAALTRRTALSLFLCGGSYLLFFAYSAVGFQLPEFLRVPLDIKDVSSEFAPLRRHPVTGVLRPHNGTDLRAPQGSRVLAAADGRVTKVAYEAKGYGNYVQIDHGLGRTTLYAHMRRVQKGVRPGVLVKKGQLIGLVGRTGLATGPHLHYELMIDGVQINPATADLPDTENLSAYQLAQLRARALPIQKMFEDAAREEGLPSPEKLLAEAREKEEAAAEAAARENKDDLTDEEAPAENQGEAPAAGGRVRPVALEEGKARAEHLGRSGK